MRLPLELHVHPYVRARRWVWSLKRRMPDQRYSNWDAGVSDDPSDFAWEANHDAPYTH